MNLTVSMQSFILHWGEMGERWGVNRTVAQVHALLYLSPEAMNAEEISAVLSVARSNVSTSLKELQNWNLIQTVSRMGDRRDYFQTSKDVWALFQTVVEQRIQREIAPTISMLRQCAATARLEEKSLPAKDRMAQRLVTERIVGMQSFLEELYGWYGQMKALPIATLRTLMSLGGGITRMLPGKRKGTS